MIHFFERISQQNPFSAGGSGRSGPRWRSLRRSSDSLVGWERGHLRPFLPPPLFGVSISIVPSAPHISSPLAPHFPMEPRRSCGVCRPHHIVNPSLDRRRGRVALQAPGGGLHSASASSSCCCDHLQGRLSICRRDLPHGLPVGRGVRRRRET